MLFVLAAKRYLEMGSALFILIQVLRILSSPSTPWPALREHHSVPEGLQACYHHLPPFRAIPQPFPTCPPPCPTKIATCPATSPFHIPAIPTISSHHYPLPIAPTNQYTLPTITHPYPPSPPLPHVLPTLAILSHSWLELLSKYSSLLLQQLNLKLFGFPYLVGIMKFNPFSPWLLEKISTVVIGYEVPLNPKPSTPNPKH